MVVLESLKVFRGKFIGGKCDGDTPRSMPNLEVKPVSVDGTVRGTHGRADHCQFRFREEVLTQGTSFFIADFYLQQSYENFLCVRKIFSQKNFFSGVDI